nr:CHAT domain-containing protein [Dendronalium sp. ChiSLP03b]MDZ8209037.1 CHAT domain-containing protein [Dendronalium sp. ChiSLP03b]
MVQTILILAANPQSIKPLRLDEEVREIDAGLQRAKQRDRFVLEQKWAVRPRDIQRAMLDINPQIVHFSGHGTGDEGLVFEDETGQAKLVDGEALAGLFDLFADRVECVVLNGCYSKVQAEAIAQHINYVIGMKKAIGDRSAIEFAVGFYDALGAGKSVEFAYKFGCAAIRLAGVPEQLTPILKKKPNISETVAKINLPENQVRVQNEFTLDSSEVLNEFDIEKLTELLIRSGCAKYFARKALCIKIGIERNQLGFINDPSEYNFAINLINHLNDMGNIKALCQICNELEPIFKGGQREFILNTIAVKLNCNKEYSQNYPNNKQLTSTLYSPDPEFNVNPFNQLTKNKLVISAMGVIIPAFITIGLPFLKKEKPTPTIPVTPLNNPLPTDSSPTLKITQPSQKSKVQRLTDFIGTFENLPKNLSIKLYVYAPSKNKYYCYTANRDSESHGHWSVNKVKIGGQGNNDRGANYKVSVLVLDSETNKGLQSCQWGSQVLTRPSNTTAEDAISVIRQ